MILDPLALMVIAAAIFLISFMKGAFGGGFAIIGIPLLALVMDPIAAGALLAPLFCLMDVVALRYWRPSTWSRPDLTVLIPGQLIGIAVGFFVMRFVDRALITTAIGVITLGFAVLWFLGGGKVESRPRSHLKGALAGVFSGVASMLAHSGGPPVAMYLLPLGLPKSVYAGTTYMFFVVGNFLKVGPWLILAQPTDDLWSLMALCVPVIVLGVWSGWKLHERLDPTQLYRVCYALLIIVAFKLLWDGMSKWAGQAPSSAPVASALTKGAGDTIRPSIGRALLMDPSAPVDVLRLELLVRSQARQHQARSA